MTIFRPASRADTSPIFRSSDAPSAPPSVRATSTVTGSLSGRVPKLSSEMRSAAAES